jgi:hypothetical protein
MSRPSGGGGAFATGESADKLPPDWKIVLVDEAIHQIRQGPRYNAKSVRSTGKVPVLDQSQTGYIGYHDDEPGVVCSSEEPVVTFANHTCNLRIVTDSFSSIQNVFAFRGLQGETETAFLYYWLQGRVSTDEYRGFFPTLRSMWLPLPPLAEQRRIAGVLGALDDLIETNQRLASDCAALRSALVRKTLAACDESVPLSSVARFVNGKNFTKDASGNGRPVIRTPEIRRGPDASTVRSEIEVGPEFMAQPGDILFVWSGSLMVERWLYEEGLVNQHIFKVVPEPGCPSWLAFGLIEFQMPWFLGLAADKATTMGHIQRGHLDAPVPWPGEDSVRDLGEVVEPLWDQELALRLEVQQLARTRDELLPLLLSGRVSVREVAA